MNKKRIFMNFVMFDALAMGLFAGYWCSLTHPLVAGFVGLTTVGVSMFIGATLAFMESDRRMIEKQKKFTREVEDSFEVKVKEAILRDRKIYGAMSVGMSKAVADRVANRIVSKHVEGMSDDGVRESVLGSVGKIVEEEIGILYEAMSHEASIQEAEERVSLGGGDELNPA